MSPKLTSTQRTFTRSFTDGTGASVIARVVIDEGAALDRVVQRLANKVRSSKTQKAASAADGVIRVTLDQDPAPKTVVTTMTAAELDARIAARVVHGATTSIIDVTITPGDPAEYGPNAFTVTPIWSNIDRASDGGWGVRGRAIAERLARALRAGVVCTNVRVCRDDNGKTYAQYESMVLGRYLNSDLKNLGF
jgi:hypothetical protein